jgi:DNA segregation ATPase FtsK/SpoIIIE, S-DNA-T family
MYRRSRRTVDVIALFLLGSGLLAILALVSHDPADPPGATVAPAHATSSNLLGEGGTEVARALIDTFGAAVFACLGAWLVLVLTLFLEGRRGAWCWRLLGWFVLVPSLALVAEFWQPDAGGLLGMALVAWLGTRLTGLGIGLVGIAGVIGGLALAGDFLWPVVGRFLAGGWNRMRQWRLRRKAIRQQQLRKRPSALPMELKAIDNQDEQLPSIPVRHLHGGAVSEEPDPDADAVMHASSPGASELEEDARSPVNAPPRRLWFGREWRLKRTEPPPVNRPAPLPSVLPNNDFQLPPFGLLDDPEPFAQEVHDHQLRERAVKLEQIFADFELKVRVVGINTGPVITQYELALDPGLRVHKVTRLADDLALNLKVPSVRMVAPLPGKDTVGVEIPNETRAIVRLKEVVLNAGPKLAKCKIPLFLGKDTEGHALMYDLSDMPHLLIAGRTGTGKSVCLNAIILSILMTRRPDEVGMLMIDPKMLELSEYGRIPHLMHPVVKDMKKAEALMSWAVDKMEERYDLLSRARVRGIAGYNELSFEEICKRVQPVDEEDKARLPRKMPYIVIFVDEFGDLMMSMRKEVEGHIIRLAQKARAAGIHLILATQKPTVDVVTGLIKSNLPARICFQVMSRTDSRVVLDEMGADKLLGKGDMLFLQPGNGEIIRAQCSYASDAEISRVVEHLSSAPTPHRELIQLPAAAKDGKEMLEALRERDPMYEPAIEIVIREQRGSVSLLQRALGIGYGRAARLVDFMAEDGIVGAYNGSNAREVLISLEQWEAMKGGAVEAVSS